MRKPKTNTKVGPRPPLPSCMLLLLLLLVTRGVACVVAIARGVATCDRCCVVYDRCVRRACRSLHVVWATYDTYGVTVVRTVCATCVVMLLRRVWYVRGVYETYGACQVAREARTCVRRVRCVLQRSRDAYGVCKSTSTRVVRGTARARSSRGAYEACARVHTVNGGVRGDW